MYSNILYLKCNIIISRQRRRWHSHTIHNTRTLTSGSFRSLTVTYSHILLLLCNILCYYYRATDPRRLSYIDTVFFSLIHSLLLVMTTCARLSMTVTKCWCSRSKREICLQESLPRVEGVEGCLFRYFFPQTDYKNVIL